MIGKLAVALAAPFAMSAMDAPARTQEGIAAESRPEIVRVQCLTSSGTAFYVGPTTLVSVAHVTDGPFCHIGGKPFDVVHRKDDFSILKVAEPVGKWLRVDCRGFSAGKRYTAWGFARGLYTLTSIDIIAKGEIFYGFSRLWGVFNVIPGQSGGPISPDGEPDLATGSVNVYNAERGDSGSTAFKDTILCA